MSEINLFKKCSALVAKEGLQAELDLAETGSLQHEALPPELGAN